MYHDERLSDRKPNLRRKGSAPVEKSLVEVWDEQRVQHVEYSPDSRLIRKRRVTKSAPASKFIGVKNNEGDPKKSLQSSPKRRSKKVHLFGEQKHQKFSQQVVSRGEKKTFSPFNNANKMRKVEETKKAERTAVEKYASAPYANYHGRKRSKFSKEVYNPNRMENKSSTYYGRKKPEYNQYHRHTNLMKPERERRTQLSSIGEFERDRRVNRKVIDHDNSKQKVVHKFDRMDPESRLYGRSRRGKREHYNHNGTYNKGEIQDNLKKYGIKSHSKNHYREQIVVSDCIREMNKFGTGEFAERGMKKANVTEDVPFKYQKRNLESYLYKKEKSLIEPQRLVGKRRLMCNMHFPKRNGKNFGVMDGLGRYQERKMYEGVDNSNPNKPRKHFRRSNRLVGKEGTRWGGNNQRKGKTKVDTVLYGGISSDFPLMTGEKFNENPRTFHKRRIVREEKMAGKISNNTYYNQINKRPTSQNKDTGFVNMPTRFQMYNE